MRFVLTILVWFASIASIFMAGLVTLEFVFMATSLDPSDVLNAGTEPWTNAMEASAAFIVFVLVTGLSLWLWHTRRFKIVGLALTACEVGGVGWVCAKVYAEYF